MWQKYTTIYNLLVEQRDYIDNWAGPTAERRKIPIHIRCGSIKVPSCSKAIGSVHTIIGLHSAASHYAPMVTSAYQRRIFFWTGRTNKTTFLRLYLRWNGFGFLMRLSPSRRIIFNMIISNIYCSLNKLFRNSFIFTKWLEKKHI